MASNNSPAAVSGLPNGHTTGDLSDVLHGYQFPQHRLRQPSDPSRTPLVLVACGSFSPLTLLHLRMLEIAADYVKHNTNYEVIGGYLSPVSDAYKKAGLASARDRLNMCQIACDKSSSWISVDDWEARQSTYSATAVVLDHFDFEVKKALGHKNVHVSLLAGADLIETMSKPGVWSTSDLNHILSLYGCLILERSGVDMDGALKALQQWKENIYVIPQLIQNDVSSTKIRSFLKKDLSVRFLIPSEVAEYISLHDLYKDEAASSNAQEIEKKRDVDAAQEAS